MNFIKRFFSFYESPSASVETLKVETLASMSPKSLLEKLDNIDLKQAQKLLTQIKQWNLLSDLRNLAHMENHAKFAVINEYWEKKVHELLHGDQAHFISNMLQEILHANPSETLLLKIFSQIQHLPVLFKEEIISRISNDKILYGLLHFKLNNDLEKKIMEKIHDPKIIKKINAKKSTSKKETKSTQDVKETQGDDRVAQKLQAAQEKIDAFFVQLEKMEQNTEGTVSTSEQKYILADLIQNLKMLTTVPESQLKELQARFEKHIHTIKANEAKRVRPTPVNLQTKQKVVNPSVNPVIKEEIKKPTKVDLFTPFKERILTGITENKEVVELHKEWLKFQRNNTISDSDIKFINQQFTQFFSKLKTKGEEKEWAKWSQKIQFEKILQQAKQISFENFTRENALLLADLKNEWHKTSKLVHSGNNEEMWNEFRAIIDKGVSALCDIKADLYKQAKDLLQPTLELKIFTSETTKDIIFNELTPKLKEIQEIYLSWPLLSGTSNDRKINTEFKKLTQDYFFKLKSFHESLGIKREENYKLKLELFEQAQKLLATKSNENPNSKTIALGLKDLQKKWYSIGPIPSDKMELQENFAKICQDFFGSQQQEFDEIQNKKKELLISTKLLIEQAKTLGEFEKIETDFFAIWDEFGYHPKNQEIQTQFEQLGNYFKECKSTILNETTKEHLERLKSLNALMENPPTANNYETVLDELQKLEASCQHQASNNKLTKDYLKKIQTLKKLWINAYTATPGMAKGHHDKTKEDLLLELQIISKITYPNQDFGPIPEDKIAQSVKVGQKIKSLLPDNDPSSASDLVFDILTQFPLVASANESEESAVQYWPKLRQSYNSFFYLY